MLEDTLVYFHVYTPDGWEAHWGARPSNGSWQAVVTEASGIDYTVTADAEGFICTPASYSIRLVGLSAYLVEGGALTDIEALHLDFHCEPVGTPTPASGG